MRLQRRHFLAAAALWAGAARANGAPGVPVPAEVGAALPGARLQGQGRLRFMGLRVYDARLWAGASASAQALDATTWAQQPLALEIEYARALDGALIAERSLQEIRRQGAIDTPTAERWQATLARLVPDVQAGDRLTALHQPGQPLRLYANGSLRGEMADLALAQRFMGIWLSAQTSEPALRLSLLGTSRP
jgi:hypothetical protein